MRACGARQVDDLKSIDALEEYVDASALIMIFVSKGYFGSKNCLREAVCTVNKRKRITLVHDSAVYLKSYSPLEEIKDELGTERAATELAKAQGELDQVQAELDEMQRQFDEVGF